MKYSFNIIITILCEPGTLYLYPFLYENLVLCICTPFCIKPVLCICTPFRIKPVLCICTPFRMKTFCNVNEHKLYLLQFIKMFEMYKQPNYTYYSLVCLFVVYKNPFLCKSNVQQNITMFILLCFVLMVMMEDSYNSVSIFCYIIIPQQETHVKYEVIKDLTLCSTCYKVC